MDTCDDDDDYDDDDDDGDDDNFAMTMMNLVHVVVYLPPLVALFPETLPQILSGLTLTIRLMTMMMTMMMRRRRTQGMTVTTIKVMKKMRMTIS